MRIRAQRRDRRTRERHRARRSARSERAAGAAATGTGAPGRARRPRMSNAVTFDPYAIFEALDRHRVSYVVVGGFARVVHGSAETTDGLDIVPSPRDETLRRLANALEDLGATGPDRRLVAAEELASPEPVTMRTEAGEVRVVPTPWGTRG